MGHAQFRGRSCPSGCTPRTPKWGTDLSTLGPPERGQLDHVRPACLSSFRGTVVIACVAIEQGVGNETETLYSQFLGLDGPLLAGLRRQAPFRGSTTFPLGQGNFRRSHEQQPS